MFCTWYLCCATTVLDFLNFTCAIMGTDEELVLRIHSRWLKHKPFGKRYCSASRKLYVSYDVILASYSLYVTVWIDYLAHDLVKFTVAMQENVFSVARVTGFHILAGKGKIKLRKALRRYCTYCEVVWNFLLLRHRTVICWITVLFAIHRGHVKTVSHFLRMPLSCWRTGCFDRGVSTIRSA